MILRPIIPIPLIIILFIGVAAFLIFLAYRESGTLPYRIMAYIRGLLISLTVCAIALRPMLADSNGELMLSNLDVLFVIDSTISMWAEDSPEGTKGRRIDTAMRDMEYIMDSLDRKSVV